MRRGAYLIAMINNLLIYFPDAAQVLYDVVLLQMAVRITVVVEVVGTMTVEVTTANKKRPLRKLSGVLKADWMKTGTKGVSRTLRVCSSRGASAEDFSTLNHKLVKGAAEKVKRKAFETNSYFLDSKNI